jgi:pyruvate-formate lyase
MTNDLPRLLSEAGEYLAAGLFEEPESPHIVRWARGLRRWFERGDLPEGNGTPLYPAGAACLPAGSAIGFLYFASVIVREDEVETKLAQLDAPHAAALREAAGSLRRVYRCGSAIPGRYSLGGGGFTHSIINYGRVLHEGLDGYARRIDAVAAANPDARDFYLAMRDVLNGVRTITERCAAHLTATGDSVAVHLAEALRRCPAQPAASFYDALAATNLLWYLDGCDNLGRFDQDLGPYLDADLASGAITRAEALELMRLVWANFDACGGWNVAIGGSTADGGPAYNTLTELCLDAAAGSRRPNLALRIRRDMSARVFDFATDAIASGCGIPALYNDEGYRAASARAFPDSEGDFHRLAYGGCTETMFHGCSNVGSIDIGLNLLSILSAEAVESLSTASDFDAFASAYLQRLRGEIRAAIACVREDHRRKAAEQPQPFRSLFIDDCIERGVEYNAGGARYNAGVLNVGGLANVADGLAAIRDLVFGGKVPAERMAEALAADFEGYDDVLRLVRAAPKFGNDDDSVDELAALVARTVADEAAQHRTARGDGPFLPATIMFVTYASTGESVPATADGRRAGEPVADSVGPMQGRDTHGPTAMLRSVSKIPLERFVGTPVLNIRLAPELFRTPEGRARFQALVRSFFDMGGMQIQATVVDAAVLRDALEHPERHGDLIVRIGGYSEYFTSLSPGLQRAVIERTEHG